MPYQTSLYFENNKSFRFFRAFDNSYSSKAVGTLFCDLCNIYGEDLLDCIPTETAVTSVLFIHEFLQSVEKKFDIPFSESMALIIVNYFYMIAEKKVPLEEVLHDFFCNNVIYFERDDLIKQLIMKYSKTISSGGNYNYIEIMKLLIELYDFERIIVTALEDTMFESIKGSKNEFQDLMKVLTDSQKIGLEILPELEEKYYVEMYIINNFHSLVLLEIINILKYEIAIHQCENCGKLFIPLVRSDEIYCNNINKNGKTCKQIGYENKINADEILKSYRTIYKTQNARKQRNRHIPKIDKRFKNWAVYAKSMLEKCQQGNITIDEMKKLLSKSDWITDDL